jgi:predicted lysophospholipase L1 biosynthesis ABC-type transport system permease subunit
MRAAVGMNATQIKCFLVMAVLEISGFGPVSLTCLIGFYVVIARPRWFLEVVRKLYRNNAENQRFSSGQDGPGRNSTATRIKCFLSLIGLFILDIAPVPVTGTIGLYIVVMRPKWFYELAEELYGGIR